MTEPVELKAGEITPLPCPFCGGGDLNVQAGCYIQCSCSASGPAFDGAPSEDDLGGAIAAWNTRLAHSAPPREPTRETFQDRVQPWMMECFGPEISADRVERCDRFIEEALELVQASGYEKDRAHALVEYVYGRDHGEVNQEVGGVMVTLAAHCLAFGVDMHEAGEAELVRIWTKIDAIRAKQATKPKHSPLPLAASPGAMAGGWRLVSELPPEWEWEPVLAVNANRRGATGEPELVPATFVACRLREKVANDAAGKFPPHLMWGLTHFLPLAPILAALTPKEPTP